jgi:hypothetical protein
MSAVTQGKWIANTFWPITVTVNANDVSIDGRKQIILWWTRPYQHVLPYRQISSVNLDQGVISSTLTLQMTGGATFNVKGLPHEGAAQTAALIREKIAQSREAR